MERPNRIRNKVEITGKDETPDTTGVEVLLQDDSEHVLMARGTTVPNDEENYAKGCIFIKTNAGDGVKALYENQGTTDSCDFNLIGDISTAEIEDGAITEEKLADGLEVVKYADVSILADKIKTLGATPVELVEAPGEGFAIIPVAVNLNLTAGTEVLSEDGDNLAVKCSTTELIEIETTGFIDQATDQNRYQEKAEAVITPVGNTALTLANKGAAEIGGNATDDAVLDVRVYYRVVPVL